MITKNFKRMSKKIFALLIPALIAALLLYFFYDAPRPHNPKIFAPPLKTQWKPEGARAAGNFDHNIIPRPETFSAIHVGTANSDSVWVAAAPMFELDWVAEPSYFIGNGPVLDNQGNLYFNPRFYHGPRVAMVSLDAQTGKRRWALPANSDNETPSAAFILNDPDNPGTQIIYMASYTRALAVRPDGSILWQTPTGLELPPRESGQAASKSLHSFNYHPPSDTLVSISKGGELFAFDRKSGKMLKARGAIPGSPAISGTGTKVPDFIVKKVDPLMDAAFGKTQAGLGIFSSAVTYIFGGGGVVTNFFSVSPDSGRIFIAATAEDGDDGTVDGRSEIGAIYVLDLTRDETGGLAFTILNRATFQGGTGSTPALSADGKRVYVSDNIGNVIALDDALNELWRVNVGEPLVGSIAVSPDNNELYAVTRKDVFKLIDKNDNGEIEWTGELTGFDGYANVDVQSNALTATVTANGVVIAIGGGKKYFGSNLMLHMGMGLLDRETGKLRYFAEGREDSLAMSIVGPDGSLYMAHSPLRRAVGKAIYPDLTPDITGGIARFKPVRLDLLARDAICAAKARAENAATLAPDTYGAAINADILHIQTLTRQARGAVSSAMRDADMSRSEAEALAALIQNSESQLIPADLKKTNLKAAGVLLAKACARFD